MLDTPFSSRRQRVCILGATGSIGTNTLDVLSRHPEQFEVWALICRSLLHFAREDWPYPPIFAPARWLPMLPARSFSRGNRPYRRSSVHASRRPLRLSANASRTSASLVNFTRLMTGRGLAFGPRAAVAAILREVLAPALMGSALGSRAIHWRGTDLGGHWSARGDNTPEKSV